jgi:hypothetical protein
VKAFENGFLKRISWPMGDKIKVGCRKLDQENLSKFYSSPNKIRIIKSRRMKWARHAARIRRK